MDCCSVRIFYRPLSHVGRLYIYLHHATLHQETTGRQIYSLCLVHQDHSPGWSIHYETRYICRRVGSNNSYYIHYYYLLKALYSLLWHVSLRRPFPTMQPEPGRTITQQGHIHIITMMVNHQLYKFYWERYIKKVSYIEMLLIHWGAVLHHLCKGINTVNKAVVLDFPLFRRKSSAWAHITAKRWSAFR